MAWSLISFVLIGNGDGRLEQGGKDVGLFSSVTMECDGGRCWRDREYVLISSVTTSQHHDTTIRLAHRHSCWMRDDLYGIYEANEFTTFFDTESRKLGTKYGSSQLLYLYWTSSMKAQSPCRTSLSYFQITRPPRSYRLLIYFIFVPAAMRNFTLISSSVKAFVFVLNISAISPWVIPI